MAWSGTDKVLSASCATCGLHACPSPGCTRRACGSRVATVPARAASAGPIDDDLSLARLVGGLEGLFRLSASEPAGHDPFQGVGSHLRELHHAFVLAEVVDPRPEEGQAFAPQLAGIDGPRSGGR